MLQVLIGVANAARKRKGLTNANPITRTQICKRQKNAGIH
jgi:hypothetical protein